MRIPSGTTNRGFYFVAVDATDLKTREAGLSSFTVVRSRNGGADATMTTPTIVEIDASTMPGVYYLTCDEDTTIGVNNYSEEMAYHITHAGMAPVTRVIELYEPTLAAVLTEPAGAPAWTAAVRTWLAWLGAKSRNKVTQTSTTQTLRNDADSANIATATVSDDGTTATRAEWA